MNAGAQEARAAADAVHEQIGNRQPAAAIILGSGLGGLAGEIQNATRILYSALPGFPVSTVPGHAGELVVGELAGQYVVAFAGRFHLYEGHTARAAAFPARVAHALGAPVLIVSNAAGGVNRLWQPGDLMLIRDHINLMFQNPLIGTQEPGDTRFPDMSAPYDAGLCALAHRAAAEEGILLREGVYAALPGPSYETAAEVRMLGLLGADAVGMSTIPEVLVARALRMKVLGFSCIANLACGLTPNPLSHDDVLSVIDSVSARFQQLMRRILGKLE